MLWASSAAATPGVIVGPGVAATAAPSDAASTIAKLGAGVTVCVLDDASYAGVVHRRPGWLAIRLPSGDVGYVHIEAVDLSAAPTDPGCREPVNLADGTGPGATTATSRYTDHRPDARASELPPPLTPLLPGGFIPLHPARVVFGMDLGAAWLRDQAAAQQQIGTTGPLIDLSAGLLIFDIVMVSGSVGVTSPPDHDMFSQVVVPVNGGDPMTADSTIGVLRYSLALGVRTPFWVLGSTRNGSVAGALFANFGWAGVSANRTISNCSDCRNDELILSGGSFWRVGVDLAIPTHSPNVAWGFTASYQSYLADASLSQEFVIGLNCWLL